jgi:hypothetical protein
MKIQNVISAKSLWFMDIRQLNPRGRNIYKVIIPQLVQWYGFTEPKEPYDENHLGVQFMNGEFSPTQDGRSGDLTGINLTVYFNGLLAHTSTSTDDADHFLEQVAARLVKEGSISFHPGLVKSKRYQSEVVAHAEQAINFPAFDKFCSILTSMAYPDSKTQMFGTTGIIFDTDSELLGVNRKRPQFTLERKVDLTWSENLYYSQAPLSTQQHEKALNALEAALST